MIKRLCITFWFLTLEFILFIWDGSDFSSGVYFYKIKSGDFSKILKMTLRSSKYLCIWVILMWSAPVKRGGLFLMDLNGITETPNYYP
ncbi:hypothetical protein ACFL1R_13165 [Candidatus Latescibacterota bacterium]